MLWLVNSHCCTPCIELFTLPYSWLWNIQMQIEFKNFRYWAKNERFFYLSCMYSYFFQDMWFCCYFFWDNIYFGQVCLLWVMYQNKYFIFFLYKYDKHDNLYSVRIVLSNLLKQIPPSDKTLFNLDSRIANFFLKCYINSFTPKI